MLDVAAGINAAMEASRVNQVGEQLSGGDGRGAVTAAFTSFLVPGEGRVAREAHHLLPREFGEFFSRAGLNIENFKVNLSRAAHRLLPDGCTRIPGAIGTGCGKSGFERTRALPRSRSSSNSTR